MSSSEASLAPGEYHHIEPEQAYHAAKFGMWIFLITEIHLFAVLFCVFAVYRFKYLAEFERHAQTLDWKLGGLNTIVLLTSSYFMVRAVDSAQRGLNGNCKTWLNFTFLCGLIFLAIKAFEYDTKFSHYLGPSTNIFYGLYFTMTGLHGVHVIAGMAVIWWLRSLAANNRFSTTYYTPVEVSGLYWHLVDIIWIYLFPLLYLIGGIK
ncbi:MAG: cytochrome c oxidase subunit 3 family protein [Deltaproteobacteria bacterium]|nr:cytochrome c oxidase subunit 3 family protein [Deltaproteobacteria bacterium]